MSSETETEDGGLTEAMTGSEEFYVESGKKPGARPGALVALLLAVAAGGAYFLYFKQGPATAKAASAAASPTLTARKTIDEFLSGGGKDIVAMEQMLKNTENVVKQFLAYPSMTQVPLADLRTNPFRFAPPETQQNSDNENRRLKDEARNRAIRAVSELQVESIMTSSSGGTAIVNGKFVRPGDQIEGFRVEAIRAGSVIVRDEQFRFELRLAR
jgi:hypothetical protein